jgi:hypothetical protein
MARGRNYWEMPYDPAGREPDAQENINELGNSNGWDHAKVSLTAPAESARLNAAGKKFSDCNFRGFLEKGSLTDCVFVGCYFVGTHWKTVKFSGCTFERCHFLHADFINCRFVDCNFSDISVSAEHFTCESTEVDVREFLEGLSTNLRHLPERTSVDYQKSRLIRDKAKIARILYRSNQELFGRQYFASHRELILYSIRAEIEEKRFDEAVVRARPIRRSRISFLRKTWAYYVDLLAVRAAGGLTDWGQSITRPLVFILTIMCVFCVVYLLAFGVSYKWAAVRSVEVSLVAGYTAHVTEKDSAALRVVTLLNLIVGIYWYSLIVPVVTRKFLR